MRRLHDLVNCTTGGECAEHVDPDVYAANLVTIATRWAPRTKKLIWSTTTPVPNVVTSVGRTYQAAITYNTAATAALLAAFPNIIINDLWADVIGFCGKLYTKCSLQLPANVHFEPAGQEFLGQAVAKVVLKALGK